jgi:hypothetical protein
MMDDAHGGLNNSFNGILEDIFYSFVKNKYYKDLRGRHNAQSVSGPLIDETSQ